MYMLYVQAIIKMFKAALLQYLDKERHEGVPQQSHNRKIGSDTYILIHAVYNDNSGKFTTHKLQYFETMGLPILQTTKQGNSRPLISHLWILSAERMTVTS